MDPETLEEKARELGKVVPLVKAHLVGREGIPDSNVIPTRDDDSNNIFSKANAIEPPFEPEVLALLLEHSNSLRQNVDAYVVNIDAFGHRFEPAFDIESSDVNKRIADAIYSERLREVEAKPELAGKINTDPTDEEVETRKKEIAKEMRIELSRLRNFFEFCCSDISFVTLRRRVRQDIETMGNGFWEVLRNGLGESAQFVYVPGFTIRLLPLDESVEVDTRIKTSDLSFETLKMQRRFRRFVQVIDGRTMFFKEFGDPRTISKKNGGVFPNVESLQTADPDDGPATELIHFKIHNPRSPYGTPRWIGNLLAVLGSRQAEEVNFLYFENKSIPPLVIMVSGGRLADKAVSRIESFIENNIKGKKNFHKILVLEAESPKGGSLAEHSGRMKIEIRPLTEVQQRDALFQNYDERNIDKVGQSFRLPRMLRGDIRDFNKSTANAALTFAEMQVFQPEREEFDFMVNRKILSDMGIKFWKFRSNAPVLRDPKTMAGVIKDLANANVLTPAESRELAGDVFNKEFKKIKAPWVDQPVQLTLAGFVFEEPESELSKADLTTGDLEAGGLLQPAQPKRPRHMRGEDEPESIFAEPGPGVSRLARLLIKARNVLKKAESTAEREEFESAKVEELEREIISVPSDEFDKWFQEPTNDD